jgi:hypothetical protein
MALVDDDEVEEVGWILTKVGRWLAIRAVAGHESLEDRKEKFGRS